MTYRLSQRSLSRLAGVHPDLARVVHRAITLTSIDFMVTCGVRTSAEQAVLYAQGRTAPGPKVTWTRTSNHFVQGDNRHYVEIARAMKEAAAIEGVNLAWGGDWTARDDVHFELK